MRKLYLVLLPFLFITSLSYSQVIVYTLPPAPSPVFKIAHNYFRSDPFETEFSSFLIHLLNDPDIKDKILEKKTDTSLFFFQGLYNKHNPFFFKPMKVEVSLGETPVKMDSLRTDTIYTYQLLAYNSGTTKGIEELKKEFQKIHRRYKSSFKDANYTENPPETPMHAASYNFFERMNTISPFAITWIGPNVDNEMCLVMTIRFKIRNNKAVLPVAFYAF